MTDLNLRVVGMYVLGVVIVAACFWLIATTAGEHVQEWATITGIIGFLIRDAGGAAGTRAAERITESNANAQPTTTVTSAGPPATSITTTPSDTENAPLVRSAEPMTALAFFLLVGALIAALLVIVMTMSDGESDIEDPISIPVGLTTAD